MIKSKDEYKIVLVTLICGQLYESSEHLGIEFLIASLKNHGYHPEFFEIFEKDDEQELKKIQQLNPDFVGFTTFAGNIKRIIKFSQNIKEFNPEVHITLGGHSATYDSEEILQDCKTVDSIVRGEGEITIVDLIDRIRTKQSLAGCLGVYYTENNQLYKNDERPLIKDLDAIPFPTRYSYKENNFEFLRVMSSRGCLGNCSFCSVSTSRIQNGPVWRGRNPENIVDELSFLVKEHNVRHFLFMDMSFEDPGRKGKERIKKIAHEIISRKLDISFHVHFRTESLTDEDDDLLRLLKKAGMDRVAVGIESGSNKGLKDYNKIARVKDHFNFIKLMKKHDITLIYGFIMFQPYSTMEELRENAQFLYDTKLLHRLEFALTRLEIYPGTSLKDRLKKDGLLYPAFSYKSDPWDYYYKDQRVEPFANAMVQLHKDDVFEFEVFDTKISAFITRIKHRFSTFKNIQEDIMKFENQISRIRDELNDNNYQFFTQCIDLAEKNWDPLEYEQLKDKYVKKYISDKKNEMKKVQYQFGIKVGRKGIDLQKIDKKRGTDQLEKVH